MADKETSDGVELVAMTMADVAEAWPEVALERQASEALAAYEEVGDIDAHVAEATMEQQLAQVKDNQEQHYRKLRHMEGGVQAVLSELVLEDEDVRAALAPFNGRDVGVETLLKAAIGAIKGESLQLFGESGSAEAANRRAYEELAELRAGVQALINRLPLQLRPARDGRMNDITYLGECVEALNAHSTRAASKMVAAERAQKKYEELATLRKGKLRSALRIVEHLESVLKETRGALGEAWTLLEGGDLPAAGFGQRVDDAMQLPMRPEPELDGKREYVTGQAAMPEGFVGSLTEVEFQAASRRAADARMEAALTKELDAELEAERGEDETP